MGRNHRGKHGRRDVFTRHLQLLVPNIPERERVSALSYVRIFPLYNGKLTFSHMPRRVVSSTRSRGLKAGKKVGDRGK